MSLDNDPRAGSVWLALSAQVKTFKSNPSASRSLKQTLKFQGLLSSNPFKFSLKLQALKHRSPNRENTIQAQVISSMWALDLANSTLYLSPSPSMLKPRKLTHCHHRRATLTPRKSDWLQNTLIAGRLHYHRLLFPLYSLCNMIHFIRFFLPATNLSNNRRLAWGLCLYIKGCKGR
jgi:hypothetical protein